MNYPAREKGVTRGMRGDEAKKKCPDIMLPKIPAIRGKADLTKYTFYIYLKYILFFSNILDIGMLVKELLMYFTHLPRYCREPQLMKHI